MEENKRKILEAAMTTMLERYWDNLRALTPVESNKVVP
jgi:hypothetical protein